MFVSLAMGNSLYLRDLHGRTYGFKPPITSSWRTPFFVTSLFETFLSCQFRVNRFDHTGSVTRFGEISKLLQKFTSLCQILTVYFLFVKMISLLWQICDIIGLYFIVANGQILKNNLTIWVHYIVVSIYVLQGVVLYRYMDENVLQ